MNNHRKETLMQQSQFNEELLKLISHLQDKVHKLCMVNLELIKALKENDLLSPQERMHLLELQSLDQKGKENGKSKTT